MRTWLQRIFGIVMYQKKEKELVADLILLTRMILKFKILDE